MTERATWLEERRRYLGGTDIAAIAGKHKYKTALSVYAEKVLGVRPEGAHQVLARVGLALEPLILELAQEDLGIVIEPGRLLRHSVYPFIGGNTDGRVQGIPRTVEIKTYGFATAKEWGQEMSDEVPDAYHVQSTLYSALDETEDTLVVAFHRDTGERTYYLVPANAEYAASLIELGVAFWNDYILPRREPRAEDFRDLETVRAIYAEQETELMVGDAAFDERAETYLELRDLSSKAQKEMDGIKAQMIQAIGSAAGLVTAAGNFTYKPRKDGVRVFRAPGGN